MAKIEPVKNFPDIEVMVNHNKTKDSEDNYEQIKLEFSINNKKDEANYLIEIKLFDGQLFDFISNVCRALPNQIVNFNKFFTCKFYFQKEQELQITLKKNNIPIEIKTTISQIVGSKDFIFKYIFSEDGDELIIKAEKLEKEDDLLDVKLSLENKSDPYYFLKNKFYYKVICKNRAIYSSGIITNDGTFESIYIPTFLLRPNYIIKIYDSQNKQIYSFPNSIDNINQGMKVPRKIILQNNNNNVRLDFADNSEIIKNYSLLDYVKSGVKIALSIGIDFSKSNKKNKKNLHSLTGSNDYERAINACANIVGYYDNDQLFPVFGFAAKIKNSNPEKTSNCFNLNFEENPDINGIDDIIRIYRECIEKDKLIFSGPTKFTPLIKEVIKRINKEDLYEYHILLILTDGVINDLDSTKDILVEASFLPLSVIIVGIGDADFSKMEILDGDEEPLVNTKGEKRARDLVQFVPFSKYENDEKKLAMEVLAEIPRQLVEYYRFKKLNPEKLDSLRSRPKIIEDKNPFNRLQNRDIRLPNQNINLIKSRDINNFNSFIDLNNFNGAKNLNDINNISIIKKRNENFVDESSYFSNGRRPSVDLSISSKNNPIDNSITSSINKRPSSIYSSRRKNSKYIPSLQNIETNQTSSYKSYQTSSTQENYSQRDNSIISIQKSNEIPNNPFYMGSKVDKQINNKNKQNNSHRSNSIGYIMSNKSRYNNNLNNKDYNPLITSGNEIINKSNKNYKRFYEDTYNNGEYSNINFDNIKTDKTIRLKKNKY